MLLALSASSVSPLVYSHKTFEIALVARITLILKISNNLDRKFNVLYRVTRGMCYVH